MLLTTRYKMPATPSFRSGQIGFAQARASHKLPLCIKFCLGSIGGSGGGGQDALGIDALTYPVADNMAISPKAGSSVTAGEVSDGGVNAGAKALMEVALAGDGRNGETWAVGQGTCEPGSPFTRGIDVSNPKTSYGAAKAAEMAAKAAAEAAVEAPAPAVVAAVAANRAARLAVVTTTTAKAGWQNGHSWQANVIEIISSDPSYRSYSSYRPPAPPKGPEPKPEPKPEPQGQQQPRPQGQQLRPQGQQAGPEGQARVISGARIIRFQSSIIDVTGERHEEGEENERCERQRCDRCRVSCGSGCCCRGNMNMDPDNNSDAMQVVDDEVVDVDIRPKKIFGVRGKSVGNGSGDVVGCEGVRMGKENVPPQEMMDRVENVVMADVHNVMGMGVSVVDRVDSDRDIDSDDDRMRDSSSDDSSDECIDEGREEERKQTAAMTLQDLKKHKLPLLLRDEELHDEELHDHELHDHELHHDHKLHDHKLHGDKHSGVKSASPGSLRDLSLQSLRELSSQVAVLKSEKSRSILKKSKKSFSNEGKVKRSVRFASGDSLESVKTFRKASPASQAQEVAAGLETFTKTDFTGFSGISSGFSSGSASPNVSGSSLPGAGGSGSHSGSCGSGSGGSGSGGSGSGGSRGGSGQSGQSGRSGPYDDEELSVCGSYSEADGRGREIIFRAFARLMREGMVMSNPSAGRRPCGNKAME